MQLIGRVQEPVVMMGDAKAKIMAEAVKRVLSGFRWARKMAWSLKLTIGRDYSKPGSAVIGRRQYWYYSTSMSRPMKLQQPMRYSTSKIPL